MSVKPGKEPTREEKEIFRAAEEGKAEKIRSLLQDLPSGQSTDTVLQCTCCSSCQQETAKFTPLSIAAYHGHTKVVKLLVEEYSVNIDQTDSEVHVVSALGAAVLGNHKNIVEYLVTRHCDVNLINSYGETAIYLACLQKNLDMATCLLENGASLQISTREGHTCLILACIKKDSAMANFLISHGFDINLKNCFNETALHFTAKVNCDSSITTLLLEHGAKMVENGDGITPVVLAAIRRSYRVIDCFAASPKVCKQDKIQGLELLGAMTLDMDIAFSYLHRAMSERFSDPNQVVLKVASPLPTLSNLKESMSLHELESRKSDHNLLQLECWATMQRVLGFNRLSALHAYKGIARRLDVDKRFKFTFSLLLHYAQSGNNPSWNIWSTYLKMLLGISLDAFLGDAAPPFADLQKVLEIIISKMPKNEDLKLISSKMLENEVHHSIRYLVALCLKCLLECLYQHPDLEEGTPWTKLAENLAFLMSKLGTKQHLLIDVIGKISREEVRFKEEGPYASALVKTLMCCGDDLNSRNDAGSTALHMVADLSEDEENQRHLKLWVGIARALLEEGALPVLPNREGKTALTLAGSSPVKNVIREYLPPSLRSLTAKAIVEHNIPCQLLPDIVTAFVKQH